MPTWTIISQRVKDGWRYHAIEVAEPLRIEFDIDMGDGEIIPAGTYAVEVDGLTEAQAGAFLAEVARVGAVSSY